VYNDTFLSHLVMQVVQEIFGVFINSRIFLIKNSNTVHARGKRKVCNRLCFMVFPSLTICRNYIQ